MSFSKEERSERARKAGLAAAAKRKAAKEAEAVQNPPAQTAVLSVDTAPNPFEPEPDASGELIAAPILDHSRVHPAPLDIPPPERPINWGAMTGRMASQSLAEAMAGGPPPSPHELAALEEALNRPFLPDGGVIETLAVRGTDMGAGRVYCEGNVEVEMAHVVRQYTTDIPGPGDSLLVYADRQGFWHQKKGA